MKIKRKIIEIDEAKCDGCGQCILGCAEGALEIVDGKAKVISDDLCDGLGACIGECPQDALEIIEREAEAFDEAAVEAHLASQQAAKPASESQPCGCPSAQLQTFVPQGACQQANQPTAFGGAAGSGPGSAAPVVGAATKAGASALSHWPIQVRLIPPTAPFLRGADLLVVADCVPVAFPTLHRDFLAGKAVMVGCPKFDDAQEYIQKFSDIFHHAGIRSVTVVVMEVPCCSGLPTMVKKGIAKAGVNLPLSEVIISTRGQILEERKVA
ncbi:MAG: 4Fe-4S ferredoxin [Desulfosarcinaceae bacterium]|nr:4Fe-4S ferredoxin [Desulfosarcinaceae bacterium]